LHKTIVKNYAFEYQTDLKTHQLAALISVINYQMSLKLNFPLYSGKT